MKSLLFLIFTICLTYVMNQNVCFVDTSHSSVIYKLTQHAIVNGVTHYVGTRAGTDYVYAHVSEKLFTAITMDGTHHIVEEFHQDTLRGVTYNVSFFFKI